MPRSEISRKAWKEIGEIVVDTLKPVLRGYLDLKFRLVTPALVQGNVPEGDECYGRYTVRFKCADLKAGTFYFAPVKFKKLCGLLETLTHEVGHCLHMYHYLGSPDRMTNSPQDREIFQEAVADIIMWRCFTQWEVGAWDDPAVEDVAICLAEDGCHYQLRDDLWDQAKAEARDILTRYESIIFGLIDTIYAKYGDEDEKAFVKMGRDALRLT
jgi:hypothetical protein